MIGALKNLQKICYYQQLSNKLNNSGIEYITMNTWIYVTLRKNSNFSYFSYDQINSMKHYHETNKRGILIVCVCGGVGGGGGAGGQGGYKFSENLIGV